MMASSVVAHKFNDDLLLAAQDQDTAREAFPDCAHVLDFEELRAFFRKFDEPANRAKARSRSAGILAVLLAALSLFSASAAPLYEGLPFAKALAGASACLGIISVTVGLVLQL